MGHIYQPPLPIDPAWLFKILLRMEILLQFLNKNDNRINGSGANAYLLHRHCLLHSSPTLSEVPCIIQLWLFCLLSILLTHFFFNPHISLANDNGSFCNKSTFYNYTPKTLLVLANDNGSFCSKINIQYRYPKDIGSPYTTLERKQ